jgi:transposase
MVNHKISNNTKCIGLCLFTRRCDTQDEIAEICDFSARTLYHTRKRYRQTGGIARACRQNPGHLQILTVSYANYMLQLAKHKPTTFLDEYQHYMEKYCHLPVSITTIHQTFERAGLNVEQV